MPIVVYERRKLIDHSTRIKFGEMNEFACRIIFIYCACGVDQVIKAVKLAVGGV